MKERQLETETERDGEIERANKLSISLKDLEK